ncbi:hypothetical protein F66182_2047 [Fusarium sp. NRRL 66182]|nr:hypothetical protein F66182_2047 [Fusarium sp. NRRL 66182]
MRASSARNHQGLPSVSSNGLKVRNTKAKVAYYGPFQERCLVPWQHAVPLPDQELSWNRAATLPVAVQVALGAWDAMGVPRMETFATSCQSSFGSTSTNLDIGNMEHDYYPAEKEALLIWGASSSVGTMGVQTARILREDANSAFAAVYATAGTPNHGYVRSLGADRVFDDKDSQVVEAITSAAREDGLVVRRCFLATGNLALCQAVLKTFVQEDQEGTPTKTAKIGSAAVIPEDAEVLKGVETIFLKPSWVEEERLGQFQYWMGTWLRESLSKGIIQPSPGPSIIGKGLDAINAALDKVSQGLTSLQPIFNLGTFSRTIIHQYPSRLVTMVLLPARHGVAISFKKNQHLQVTNTHGKQVVDFWAFNPNDSHEYLSTSHTRASLSSISPQKGNKLYSSRRRPILTFVEDTSPGIHDLLFPACDSERYRQLGAVEGHASCHDNMHTALKSFPEIKIRDDWVPDPLNLFMNVAVDHRGGIEIRGPTSEAGQYVVLKAEMDLVVVMSACPQDMVNVNADGPADCAYQVFGESQLVEKEK